MLAKFIIAFLVAGFLAISGPSEDPVIAKSKIWAGISIEKPVFVWKEETKFLPMHFALINDGDETIDPRLRSCELLVNGRVPKNWEQTINNGPRDKRWRALPPGDVLHLTIAFEEEFRKPGVYKVMWKGKEFKSAEIEFRVVTEEKAPN